MEGGAVDIGAGDCLPHRAIAMASSQTPMLAYEGHDYYDPPRFEIPPISECRHPWVSSVLSTMEQC